MAIQNKWPKRDNRVTRKDLRDRIDRHSRQPFQDLLSSLLQCRPDPISLLEFATAHPDKWAAAIGVIARLAGYHDKLVVEETLTVNINNMSDAQLHQRLQEARRELGLIENPPQQNVIASSMLIEQEPQKADVKKPSPAQGQGGLLSDG